MMSMWLIQTVKMEGQMAMDFAGLSWEIKRGFLSLLHLIYVGHLVVSVSCLAIAETIISLQDSSFRS